MKRKYLIAALLLPTVANADYTPDTIGWWQLQDLSTFAEVCTSNSTVCDPDAGTYRLIDFGTDPATRTTVTIENATAPDTTIDVRDFIQRATYTSNGLSAFTEAVCPGGIGEQVAVMGTCTATVDGIAVPIASQQENFGFGISGWGCRTDSPAVITVHALCIATGLTYEDE